APPTVAPQGSAIRDRPMRSSTGALNAIDRYDRGCYATPYVSMAAARMWHDSDRAGERCRRYGYYSMAARRSNTDVQEELLFIGELPGTLYAHVGNGARNVDPRLRGQIRVSDPKRHSSAAMHITAICATVE